MLSKPQTDSFSALAGIPGGGGWGSRAGEGSRRKSMRGLTLGFQLALLVAPTQRLGREVPNAWTEASGA